VRNAASASPGVSDAEYIRSVEDRRAKALASLRGPTSVLAAVARHELPVGSRLRFGPGDGVDVRLAGMPRDHEIRALADGFTVDGVPSQPRSIDAGRYTLRLSHQNYPAVVVLDAQSPRLKEEVTQRWYPVDPALRIRSQLQADSRRGSIASTASADRPAERVGWIPFAIAGVPVRLAATHLLEPGYAEDHLDVLFRDGTTGQGSYEVGRYVTVERDGDDVIVDFNLAYNPSCALAPFYNCPIPPEENRLTVPIVAGEMTPLITSPH
jgi:uncharacterized protein (DUF1684 family)